MLVVNAVVLSCDGNVVFISLHIDLNTNAHIYITLLASLRHSNMDYHENYLLQYIIHMKTENLDLNLVNK